MSLKNPFQCKYITSDKLHPDNIRHLNYKCEDMSVPNSQKKYVKDENCDKDNKCFGYIQLYYLKNPQIYITTPPMKCLFGVQKTNQSFSMSLQFTNLDTDPNMKQLFDFIQNSEFRCMEHLGLKEDETEKFSSQIKYDKKGIYEPNLTVKLPFSYNKFQTDLYSDNEYALNIFNIPKFQLMECDIYADKVWKLNDIFYMKWKCRVIHIL